MKIISSGDIVAETSEAMFDEALFVAPLAVELPVALFDAESIAEPFNA